MSQVLISARLDAGGLSTLWQAASRVGPSLDRRLRYLSAGVRALRDNLYQSLHMLSPRSLAHEGFRSIAAKDLNEAVEIAVHNPA
jgi:hypothetical protein